MLVLIIVLLLTLIGLLSVYSAIYTFVAAGRASGGGASGASGAQGPSGGASGPSGWPTGYQVIGDLAVLTPEQSGTVFIIDAPPGVHLTIPDAAISKNVYYDFVVQKIGDINLTIVSSGGNILALGTPSTSVIATLITSLASFRFVSDGTRWIILYSNVSFINQ